MGAVEDPHTLASVALFRGLPADTLARLGPALHRRTFPAGSNVLTAEQSGEALYVILSGSVRIFLAEADGAEVTLAFLGPGDTLGEMSLVDHAGRSANAVTHESSVLLWMDRTTFVAFLREQPQLCENMVRELAARLRAANRQIRALTTLDVTGRVAFQLLAFAAQYGRQEEGGVRIPFPLSQQDIAEIVGATRERVNRALVSMRRQGALSVDARHRFTLHDRDGLQRLCAPRPK